MARKSPYRHHVRKYKRKVRNKTVQVTDYMRGQGKQAQRKKRRRIIKKVKDGAFTGTITYTDKSSENFEVPAKTYLEALDKAIMKRKQLKTPSLIQMRKSD